MPQPPFVVSPLSRAAPCQRLLSQRPRARSTALRAAAARRFCPILSGALGLLAALVLLLLPAALRADGAALFNGASFTRAPAVIGPAKGAATANRQPRQRATLRSAAWSGARQGLHPHRAAPLPGQLQRRAPSLFTGRTPGGLFADRPPAPQGTPATPRARLRGSDVDRLRALIGAAESRRDGYDAVQHGARIRPPRRPTQMTLAEILAWVAATPGQPHAIGRYQFIPATFKRIMAKLKLNPGARFTPALQDRMGDVLLAEAGFHRFRAGNLSRVAFMNNLAKIWAGLPNDSGRSHYHGHAGNAASISWARFAAEMAHIGPPGRS